MNKIIFLVLLGMISLVCADTVIEGPPDHGSFTISNRTDPDLLKFWISAQPETVRVAIPVPAVISNPVAASNQVMLNCAFWTEWIVETNTSPVIPLLHFDNVSPGGKWTNSFLGNTAPPLPGSSQSAMVRTDLVHTETLFVSSNLFSYLVWRGVTNRQCLESVPITNIVRKFRYEVKKTYSN